MKTPTPAAELRAWRERQPTANPRADHLTQAEAELWYGLWNGGRTWKRWEAGDHPVPEPLLKRIRAGVKVDTDEAEGYAAQVFERTLSPGQKNALLDILGAHRRHRSVLKNESGEWWVPAAFGPGFRMVHGSTMRAFVDRGVLAQRPHPADVIYRLTNVGLALAERVEAAAKKRRRRRRLTTTRR